MRKKIIMAAILLISVASLIKVAIASEGYTCTKRLQEFDVIPCPSPIGGYYCYGYWEIYYPRLGCEPAPTGECHTERMVRSYEGSCELKAPGYCGPAGDVTFYYMRACG